MLSNAYFLAKFRFDTAEKEPAKNLQNFRVACLSAGVRAAAIVKRPQRAACIVNSNSTSVGRTSQVAEVDAQLANTSARGLKLKYGLENTEVVLEKRRSVRKYVGCNRFREVQQNVTSSQRSSPETKPSVD